MSEDNGAQKRALGNVWGDRKCVGGRKGGVYQQGSEKNDALAHFVAAAAIGRFLLAMPSTPTLREGMCTRR